MGKKVFVGNNAKDILGPRGAINTHHEGITDPRQTEKRANLDNWSPPPEKRKNWWELGKHESKPVETNEQSSEASEPAEGSNSK